MSFANSQVRDLSGFSHIPQLNDQVIDGPTCKMIDGFFNDARLNLIKTCKVSSLYSSLKIIALVSLEIWIYTYHLDMPYISALNLAIVANLLRIWAQLRVMMQANNLRSTLAVAESLNHCREEPVAADFEESEDERVEQRVSATYDFQNIIDAPQEEVTEKFSELIEPVYSFISIGNHCITILSKLLSLVFIVVMIVTLNKHACSMPTKIVSLVILMLEIISRLDFIICLLIMSVIIPLVIILVCVLCCCGSWCIPRIQVLFPSIRLGQQQPFNIQNHPQLQPIQFQANTLLQTSADCNICFQNFQIGDKILILPCNNKHIFHQFCITTWFRASETCPICRRTLTEMANAPSAVSP